jgi:TetR/AcrR family transcriptional repressor of nem operon
MAQETFETAPPIRDACYAAIAGHAATLEADFAGAIERYGTNAAATSVTAAALAMHTQAVLQGGFVLAKARNDPAPVLEQIDHLRRYFTLLFGRGPGTAPPR